MPAVWLVRHGRSAPHPDTPPETWVLADDALADIDALRSRLPDAAAWFTSPEPKALGTARRLRGADVPVVDALAEHRRGPHWFDDPAEFRAAVRRVFARPTERAVSEWEPLADLEARLVPAVREILAKHPDEDVVLVGHGTAWTLLRSVLTGEEPDLEAWAALRMPDVWKVQPAASR
jgi:broad specificity phosphatase PhoE